MCNRPPADYQPTQVRPSRLRCVSKVHFMSMAKGFTQPLGESEQAERPEESYTSEQLEKGHRMMASIRQAGVLAAERIRRKEALKHLAALPCATRFIN